MPQGAWTDKRERQYDHIKSNLKKRGRPEETAERIAAATVNQTRTAKGETKEAKPPSERARAKRGIFRAADALSGGMPSSGYPRRPLRR